MHAVRVTVICEECVRIEYAPDGAGSGGGESGHFCDFPSLFAIHGPAGDESRIPDMALPTRVFTTSAQVGSAPIDIRTRRLRLVYTPDGRPPHAGNMHALIDHPAPLPGVETRDGKVVWTPGAQNRFNLGGTLSTLDGLRGSHPLGEGLLARDGWHMVDDSRRHILVDGWAATRESRGVGTNTDWYLFAYGDDYPAALRAMTIIAGRIPMPRRALLGSWYSRFWPYTSDEYRGIVDEFELHDFPLDVLVLDMDWHKPGWTGWSWNRELIPKPDEFLAWLHARGLSVSLNLHPSDGVAPHEDLYAPFMRALGREPDGSTVPFDAGDRNYMRSLFDVIHRPLEDAGCEEIASTHPTSDIPHRTFFWLDWQQDKYARSIPGLTNLRWLNHLYFQHTLCPATPTDPGRRGVSFSRWAADDPSPDPDTGTEWGHPATGGWGDHRHPIHFSGDAHTGWNMLAFQVPFTATAGNIGCFFWSHDIGGHFGPRLEETTARWVQFGALSAALRVHSARAAALDRRPWTYEERFRASMHRAYALRSRLMPYIYSTVRRCHEDALPLLRPMYLHAPREERAHRVPQQYLLGEDLLAAPVVTPGLGPRCVATQHLWFPTSSAHPTSAWHDLETADRHEAGAEAIIAADIHHTPLYLRAGILLPMRPSTHRMTTEPLDHLILRCFPGDHAQLAERNLYEDDGETLDHERGRFARTPLIARWAHAQRDGRSVITLDATIGPTTGEYLGQPAQRTLELQIGAVHRVLAVSGAQDWSYDADAVGGLATARIDATDIRTLIRLSIDFEPADPRLIAYHLRQANFVAACNGDPPKPPRPLGGIHFREAVVGACCAKDPTNPCHDDRRSRLLAIGAGIAPLVESDTVRLIDTLGWIDGSSVHVEFLDCLGAHEFPISDSTPALVRNGSHARAAAAPLPDRPFQPAQVGLRSSRIARFRFMIDKAPIALDAVVHSALAPLTEFLAVGPFSWDWRTPIGEAVFQPEQQAPVDPSAVFPARDGARVEWRPAIKGAKWDIDLRASLSARGGLAYAATSILATRAHDATLHFECGDKLEAFLNGVKIITLDDFAAHASPDPFVRIRLREGRNDLLIKTTDGGGGWGFSASIEADRAVIHERPQRADFTPTV